MMLNKEQAKSVYDAMCALNNIGGALDATFPGCRKGETFNVVQRRSGRIFIIFEWGGATRETESYEDQTAFIIAYGIV